jgi:hypothetical protein
MPSFSEIKNFLMEILIYNTPIRSNKMSSHSIMKLLFLFSFVAVLFFFAWLRIFGNESIIFDGSDHFFHSKLSLLFSTKNNLSSHVLKENQDNIFQQKSPTILTTSSVKSGKY